MPYIPEKEQREMISRKVDYLAKLCRHKGDLNYTVTRLIHMWIIDQGGAGYQRCSDAMNALTDAAREFYRRIMAPYEDIKIRENGEVSPLEEQMNPVKIQRKKGAGGGWLWIKTINIHHGPNGFTGTPNGFTGTERDAMTFPKSLADRHLLDWPASEGMEELKYRIVH